MKVDAERKKPMNLNEIRRLLRSSPDDRPYLPEVVARALLDAMEISTPACRFVRDAPEADKLDPSAFPGELVVVKVVASDLPHRTVAGGVATVPNERRAIRDAVRALSERFSSESLEGFGVYEFVPHERALGHEFLLGLRWTEEFGAVVVVGPGGVHAEHTSRHLVRGRDMAILSAELCEGEDAIRELLEELAVIPLFATALPGRFRTHRLDAVVDVHNPVDLTPMMADAGFASAVRWIMNDENVDVGVVGCVPMTPALQTLTPGPGHDEDFSAPGAVGARLADLGRTLDRAWVSVVDGGAAYDALANYLRENGIPTFRSADRAIRLFQIVCRERLRPRT